MKLIAALIMASVLFLLAAGAAKAAATNRYVATNAPNPGYPYDSWGTAGTNIIEVVNVANANNAGDLVIVSNGTYYLTNQVNITNTVVTNFSGDRTTVIINGNYDATTNRCFYLNHANAKLSGFTITNGYAFTLAADSLGSGGGVAVIQGLVHNCLITGCRARPFVNDAHGGGGLYVGSSAAKADYCSIVGNVVTQGYGGGAAVVNNGVLTNCFVAYNLVTNNNVARGGGIFTYGAKINNCTILGNTSGGLATGGYGSGWGGGVWMHADGGITEIFNCNIISNRGDTYGGGIYGSGGGFIMRVRNCLIYANSALRANGGYGGGIYLNGRINVDGCTVVSNKALVASGGGGGGIGLGSSIFLYTQCVWNCIFYYNEGHAGADLYTGVDQVKTSIAYSCTSPGSGWTIEGGVTSPPGFVAGQDGNWRLANNSPCLNAGTNMSWMTDAVDLDGRRRIDRFNGRVDMGAYELINAGTLFNCR